MPLTPNNSSHKQQNISRFESLIDDLKRLFSKNLQPNLYQEKDKTIAIISVAEQKLYCLKNQKLDKSYSVSTAEAGTGNLSGSYQTPLGIHRIAEKIGANEPIASIFTARKNTHQIAKTIHDPNIRSDKDNITSRILWLDGLENGFNKGLDKNKNNVDSFSRYIYIHGTDEEGLIGQVASHGCVRMTNEDVIEFFNKVEIGHLVVIIED